MRKTNVINQRMPSLPTSTVWDERLPSFRVPTSMPSWPPTPFWIAMCPSSLTCPDTSSPQALVFYKQLNTTFPPITTGSQPHPLYIMGGGHHPPHLPDFWIQHPLHPLHFVMGGGSTSSDYTASEWGASSADVTSSWSANSACSSHHSRILPSCHNSPASQHPDPNGLDASQAPPPSHHLISHHPIPPSSYYRISCAHVQTIFTGGGPGCHGGMSPLTYQGSGSIGEGVSTAGPGSVGGTAADPRSIGGTASFPLGLEVQSVLSTRSSAPTFVPLTQPDVSLVVSILKGSSSDPFVPPPPLPAPPQLLLS